MSKRSKGEETMISCDRQEQKSGSGGGGIAVMKAPLVTASKALRPATTRRRGAARRLTWPFPKAPSHEAGGRSNCATEFRVDINVCAAFVLNYPRQAPAAPPGAGARGRFRAAFGTKFIMPLSQYNEHDGQVRYAKGFYVYT
ncbi:hypothetical protein EVAR_44076_1 [Eumeta japonica]|uniref:Uncharacterized protein n=1 Tax=Eumeta variegata TaxID=151549 RepID=A0A4C1X4F8_EUMVA|nr:hypothetical protein EVAR_44076_1 [Eumeta japonica]